MDMLRPTKTTETDKYNHRKDTPERNDVATTIFTTNRQHCSDNHMSQFRMGGVHNIWNCFLAIKTKMMNSMNEKKKMYIVFLVLLFVACVVSVSTENDSFQDYSGGSFVAERADSFHGDEYPHELKMTSTSLGYSRNKHKRKGGGGAVPYSMAKTSYGTAAAAAHPEMMNLKQVDPVPPPPIEDENSVNDKEYAKDKMLVYRGSVTIETLEEDMETLADGIISICQGKGNGYIEREERTKYSIQLNLRIASMEYQSIVKSIKTTVDDVKKAEILRLSTSIQDVTTDYIDSSSRAETLLASRKAMMLLLDKATKVNEILQVQRELNSLTQEYESKKSQMNYLKSQADFSYMTVHLQAKDEYMDLDKGPWDPLVPFWQACDHMAFLGLFAANMFIYALVWAIPCFVVALIISLLFRKGQ